MPERHGKTEEVGGAFPRRSISAPSGTGLVAGLARRELRNRAYRKRSRIRFESGSPTTFRGGQVPVRRFHSTAPSIPILNHSYAAFKQMSASSGSAGPEWRVSRLRRNAVPVPRFDVRGRLRLTLTASQTFGSTYFFVRLVKNLSGPLIRCDSQKPPGEKSKRFARLILRRLSAYCLQTIWNWSTLFRGSGRAAEKPAALRGPAAGGKIPSGPELGSTFRIDAFLVLRQSQRQR